MFYEAAEFPIEYVCEWREKNILVNEADVCGGACDLSSCPTL